MSNTFSQNSDNNFKDIIPLTSAELGTNYVIESCSLPAHLQTRFSELGFVKGTKIAVIKKAPLGDPLEVTLLGYSMCARANELKNVLVTRADDE